MPGGSVTDDPGRAFGELLRRWRRSRGLTQEELGFRAEFSQRHISFLETGRSRPSRRAAAALARSLRLPLRDRNRLLEAAGFAPTYPEGALSEPELAHARRLFAFLLHAHEPFPAYVIDGLWNVVSQNRAARRSQRLVLGRELDPDEGANLLRELFEPGGFRPAVVNFDELAGLFLDRLRWRLSARPEEAELAALVEELEALWSPRNPSPPESSDRIVVPVHIRRAGLEIRLASAIMGLSTPRHVSLEELRVETFLPADAATERTLRRLAREEEGGRDRGS